MSYCLSLVLCLFCFILFCFVFIFCFHQSCGPSFNRSSIYMRSEATRTYLITICVLFCFCFFPFCFFGDVTVSEYFYPFLFSRCMETTSYVFPFRMVFFLYFVTTGWSFDISYEQPIDYFIEDK